jgi:hypothetical protein
MSRDASAPDLGERKGAGANSIMELLKLVVLPSIV